jgi:predicted transcriptional regulator
LKNEPPANRMISRIANRNPGIANPTMIIAEVQVSNLEPSITALRNAERDRDQIGQSVIQMPSDIETGSFP